MDIKLIMHSMFPWENKLEDLIAIFSRNRDFFPDTWGITEGKRYPLSLSSIDEVEKLWLERKGILFKRRKPDLWISIEWWPNAKFPGRFSMGVTKHYFCDIKNVSVFLDFAKDTFLWGKMVYGFACHSEEYERKNVLPKPIMVNGKLVKTVNFDPLGCLPGVYWANFWGNRYIEQFGVNVIKSAPCYDVEFMEGGGVLILSSPNPLSFGDSNVHLVEESLLDYFGVEFFFDAQNPSKVCASPFR